MTMATGDDDNVVDGDGATGNKVDEDGNDDDDGDSAMGSGATGYDDNDDDDDDEDSNGVMCNGIRRRWR